MWPFRRRAKICGRCAYYWRDKSGYERCCNGHSRFTFTYRDQTCPLWISGLRWFFYRIGWSALIFVAGIATLYVIMMMRGT